MYPETQAGRTLPVVERRAGDGPADSGTDLASLSGKFVRARFAATRAKEAVMAVSGVTRAAFATGNDFRQAVDSVAERLSAQGEGGSLGLVYVTDKLNGRLRTIVAQLRERTGIEDWVGTVGLGVMCGRDAAFDEPAIAAMITNWPKDQYQLYDGVPSEAWSPPAAAARNGHAILGMMTALVHADPRNPKYPGLLGSLSAASGAYLVGGVTASRSEFFDQVAGKTAEGDVSGVLLGPGIAVAVGVSQGCSAIGPVRSVTAATDNLITRLEEGTPFQALLADLDIKDIQDQDALREALQALHVALPVPNCDTGDYVVRNLVSIDLKSGGIAIAEPVEPGRKLFFCRRDRAAATKDLQAMLHKVQARSSQRNGAVYISCCGRGPNLFGSAAEEARLVQNELGDLPLIGFYANGEIAGERLYGYTGVLAVF
jgi:small ligand-binding sensory domain FIST